MIILLSPFLCSPKEKGERKGLPLKRRGRLARRKKHPVLLLAAGIRAGLSLA